MPEISQTGFYGKLPCRGDFMQRRAPQGFVDGWDAWLQECLHASRQQLGERWLDLYLTSPVWRFVLAEGICGESAYAGVMLPSVDRVGRYFPLTLISPLQPGSCLLEAACGTGRAWFDAVEELALRALDASDLDVEAFDAEVDGLPGLGASAALGESNQLMELVGQSAFARGGAAWHISMLGETPQRAVNALASIELQKTFRPCALWWTQGSEAVQPGWLVTSGLPTPSGYVAMLSGQWLATGWNSVEIATQAPVETPTVSATTDLEVPPPIALQIVAAHPPPRHGLRAPIETRYITRPETGLWGVVTASGVADPGARADLIADVVHDLAPQATLTARVESTRRALDRVLAPETSIVLFLAERTEYALLWSGSAQAVRLRGATAVELLGRDGSPEAGAAADVSLALPPDGDRGGAEEGGLLALLAAPATPKPTVRVLYQELEANDFWVLGIAGSIPETLPDEARDPGSAPSPQRVLEALVAGHASAVGSADAPPLMLLAAQHAERAST